MTAQTSERRAAILEAAQALWTERGRVTAISLQEVARRAGVTKVTLYRYFPSKDALFAEVAALDGASAAPGRRDQIIDAAMRVIPRSGLAGVTMEKIAAEAGVSAPTLYWHFKNKDDLLIAMIERVVGQVDVATLLPTEPVEDVESYVRALLPRILTLLNAPFSLMPTVLGELSHRPDLAAIIYDRVLSRMWATATLFMDAQTQAGVFRPGSSLVRVYAMIGMLFYYTIVRRNFGDLMAMPSPEAAADEFASLFLHGVLAVDSEVQP